MENKFGTWNESEIGKMIKKKEGREKQQICSAKKIKMNERNEKKNRFADENTRSTVS